jgi:hypothetical protein
MEKHNASMFRVHLKMKTVCSETNVPTFTQQNKNREKV